MTLDLASFALGGLSACLAIMLIAGGYLALSTVIGRKGPPAVKP
jgi:hypothetical protein